MQVCFSFALHKLSGEIARFEQERADAFEQTAVDGKIITDEVVEEFDQRDLFDFFLTAIRAIAIIAGKASVAILTRCFSIFWIHTDGIYASI